jgi:four helix bundle protein
MAKKLDELRVYQRAMEFSKSVTALLDRQTYRKDRDLWGQTSEANDSIPSNISEGFEQGSDPMFVKYLFYSKGSLGEVVARLRQAQIKRYITVEELAIRVDAAERLSRSLGAFIRYLDECGWPDRGRHQSRLRAEARAVTEGRETKGPRTEGPSDQGPSDQGPRD